MVLMTGKRAPSSMRGGYRDKPMDLWKLIGISAKDEVIGKVLKPRMAPPPRKAYVMSRIIPAVILLGLILLCLKRLT